MLFSVFQPENPWRDFKTSGGWSTVDHGDQATQWPPRSPQPPQVRAQGWATEGRREGVEVEAGQRDWTERLDRETGHETGQRDWTERLDSRERQEDMQGT